MEFIDLKAQYRALKDDIDAGIVGHRLDFNICRAVTLHELAVATEVERAVRHAVEVCNRRQQALVDR